MFCLTEIHSVDIKVMITSFLNLAKILMMVHFI